MFTLFSRLSVYKARTLIHLFYELNGYRKIIILSINGALF